ncbi:serine protein kinase RIO, partial [Candidatus Bathyarchaeota archaeon]|nr:serine protein kinase RIO [Candidatus Bathyarchaeota archaeon]
AVPLEHPNSEMFLMRDLRNLNRYFSKLGVKVLSIDELYRRVTGVHS